MERNETNALLARLDAIEAAAYEAMFVAAPRPFADAVGLAAVRDHGAVMLFAPRLPTTQFNRVIGLGNDGAVSDQALDAIVAAYRARGVGEFWIHVGPAAPADLADRLLARGFRAPPRRAWAKVVRGVEPPPPVQTTLDVRELTASDGPLFSRVVLSAFGMPPPAAVWVESFVGRSPFRCYAAFDGADAVSVGLTFVHGDAVWLGLGSTLASHRGRGGQGAIIARRITDAVAAGATLITTETGEPIDGEKNPSLANMFRMGFRQVASRLNFGPG